jgi:hypothetical protein
VPDFGRVTLGSQNLAGSGKYHPNLRARRGRPPRVLERVLAWFDRSKDEPQRPAGMDLEQ